MKSPRLSTSIIIALFVLASCGRSEHTEPLQEETPGTETQVPTEAVQELEANDLATIALSDILTLDRHAGLRELDNRLQTASPEEKRALLEQLLPYLREYRDPAFLSDATSLLAREYANYDLPDGVGRPSFSFEAVFVNYALLELPLRQDAVDALTRRLERRGTPLVPFERLDVLLMGFHQIEGFESALDDIVRRGRGLTYPTALAMQARHGDQSATDLSG